MAFSQELSAGFTVIYGNNEAGKTTLMDFLQLMFYGSSVGGRIRVRTSASAT
ncbi:AAA family ATPase [Levyella massiliensis]|uniref:AAA family ATPase n=1 Tax=Levyella massiliensis TaxID=938289 RepID=UPI003EB732C3